MVVTIVDMDKAFLLGHRDVSTTEESTELSITKCVVSKYYCVHCYTPQSLPVYIHPSFVFILSLRVST